MSEPLSIKEISLRLAHAESMSGDFDGNVLQELADELREEGRREILAEIAALESPRPYTEEDRCFFCRGKAISVTVTEHKADCLWLRATQEPVK